MRQMSDNEMRTWANGLRITRESGEDQARLMAAASCGAINGREVMTWILDVISHRTTANVPSWLTHLAGADWWEEDNVFLPIPPRGDVGETEIMALDAIPHLRALVPQAHLPPIPVKA
ncbi:hypothetical protein ACS3SW_17360 [Roseobacteraceae bacterium S113]